MSLIELKKKLDVYKLGVIQYSDLKLKEKADGMRHLMDDKFGITFFDTYELEGKFYIIFIQTANVKWNYKNIDSLEVISFIRKEYFGKYENPINIFLH